MPSAILCIEHTIDKISLVFAFIKTQYTTYRLYYTRCRLRTKAEYDVVQALYRDASAHYLYVWKQDISVTFFEVAAYFFAVLYFSLSVRIERRLIRIQRFKFLEQVLAYVYFIEEYKRISAHRRGLVEYRSVQIAIPFREVFMLRPGSIVEIYSVIVRRDVFYRRIFMEKQIAVCVYRPVEHAIDGYTKLGYESAVLEIHRVFAVYNAAKHTDELFQFIFVTRKRTWASDADFGFYALNHFRRAFR